MAEFSYKGRDSQGELVSGNYEAVSADAVANYLLGSGITPVNIDRKQNTDSAAINLEELLGLGKPTLTEMVMFTRQLYTLVRSGVPLNRGLQSLSHSLENKRLMVVLAEIQHDLESGRELSVAMARHPQLFSSLYVNMVKVGENTGRLDDALLRIGNYLELEKDTRERVKTALRYPAFVVAAILIAVVILNIFVIPTFRNMFDKAGVELPLPTRILMGSSDFFVAFWPHMLLMVIAAFIGLRWYISTNDGRYQWDRFKLKIPIAGDIIRRATLGRFARAFSMSLSAGVPLVQALGVLSKAVDNDYIGKHIKDMRTGIERGDSLSRTAHATQIFTPLVLQMLVIGEETGSVDDMLAEVAEFYEREVDYDIKNLSASIEPIMITIIACMVLILALGIFVPMWDMASIKLKS